MSGAAGGPVFLVASPTGAVGAIAVVELRGLDDACADVLGLPRLDVGEIRLADLLGVDRGMVCRLSENRWLLTPHGGAAVVAGLVDALRGCGVAELGADARLSSEQLTRGTGRVPVEGEIAAAELSAALARAASPLAIDLLIEQPRRWAVVGAASDPGLDAVRNRLITPPSVVAVGPPNIGKSSLLNALAGRDLAIVADEPGTTRDHVGAMIDMGGLVVRYIDTPGIRAGAGSSEVDAIRLATATALAADLVLRCCDHTAGPVGVDGPASFIVGLRSDLGPAAAEVDIAVSAATGAGVADLVGMIRERLAPARAISDPTPWRFWDGW